ncbi:MAG: RecQ family ATP-dependent DNA helicase [Muribaculaceae bacterium]|nr:RecQ family ATP-dependent DNA helicase [Muribaculaceae bacterium]
MSFWNKIIDAFNRTENRSPHSQNVEVPPLRYAFVDIETGLHDNKIHDIGAIRWDGAVHHSANKKDLITFLRDVIFVCGHNIINHDAKYLFSDGNHSYTLVDTLFMAPLLFPERPYHSLVKDDKLISEQLNNPVNDCEKARDLLMDEVAIWERLPVSRRMIYATLLQDIKEFKGFLAFVNAKSGSKDSLAKLIRSEYRDRICWHADIESAVRKFPCELAYALALVDTSDRRSITPAWVLHNFPNVENIVRQLRHNKCKDGCEYCNRELDVHVSLKRFFGFEKFRTYDGEPLQENAVRAAVGNKSLLAIFPTGGGKSLTFQLPALMEGLSVHGLTVVISPLQSLMKDQVDNLADRGITDAVTINGLLDPLSRSEAIQRVMDGDASILYISPEMLRSKTIEKILLARHLVRVVIDEAHCFSSWGQDFRVDYLYIGKFLSQYQKKKRCDPIPISCFTATAKQKVIQDICDYFKRTLNIELEIFASSSARKNLRYSVIHVDTDEEKYVRLRSLIAESSTPTIVYVSRTKRTRQLAAKLTRDGFKALPFDGKMDAEDKIANQDAFMNDKVRIIVATSAFGMGVDKKDVGLVIHYDISDSLENYIQEAGRAGRDPHIEARCFVLYSDADLDKHFILLNQTKLSISEIQQVWKAVKDMTRQRMRVCSSALEIARQAGWDDSVSDIETRVRTALAALEQAGYLERGNNVPHVYATGITVKDMEEARQRITESLLFENEEVDKAVRIIKSLISQKYTSKIQDAESESRIDYLADILGLSKREVVSCVVRMRQEGILADSKDISAYLYDSGDSENKSKRLLERFTKLERYILGYLSPESCRISYKQLNDNAQKEGVETATEKDIRTLLYFLTVKGYVRKKEDGANNIELTGQTDIESTLQRFEKRLEICQFAIGWLYKITLQKNEADIKNNDVRFSIVELLNDLKTHGSTLLESMMDVQLEDVEEALLYLSKIGALKLEGGFMVLYNAMDIRRIKDNRMRYKQEDYRMLNEFYRQKIQQIHIVGEFANLMVRDYQAALQYVYDYFQMDYRRFISKYFKGERIREIERNVTPEKYRHIFGSLSEKQLEIISDKESRCIVVAAGPGSGKTRVLVHKLASLLLLEDVKHEQLLMLTFSRASATEFKQRLLGLIGNAAHFVEIKTFHSYCFDLLGRIGSLDSVKDVVSRATQMIVNGEVEPNRIAKTVLVIDEAQDMSAEEYALLRALMAFNEEMRVIAVGDDDQNIFEFRGSDSRYMSQLLKESDARFIEMTENYRSSRRVVDFANVFVDQINGRMKTHPIVSMNQMEGGVFIRHYISGTMYEPLVNDLLSHRRQGSICVLTQTNEEATIMVALLRKHGLSSRLIQNLDGFRFWNMAEVRMFLKQIDVAAHTPVIPDDVWEKAKQKTYSRYANSSSVHYLQRCLSLFEQTNKVKYHTDFKEFVFESSIEDFCDLSGVDVVVSTIHKAKGLEFDDVYMLITKLQNFHNKDLRRYYVGATRAKERLFLHTDTPLFDRMPADEHLMCLEQYGMPDEIVLQLSHRDVNLGFFKTRKNEILSLRAGQTLRFVDNYLYELDSNRVLAQLSQKMQGELQTWVRRGYLVDSASIRFIVAWRPKDAPQDEKEHAVLLVDLVLKKESGRTILTAHSPSCGG